MHVDGVASRTGSCAGFGSFLAFVGTADAAPLGNGLLPSESKQESPWRTRHLRRRRARESSILDAGILWVELGADRWPERWRQMTTSHVASDPCAATGDVHVDGLVVDLGGSSKYEPMANGAEAEPLTDEPAAAHWRSGLAAGRDGDHDPRGRPC